MLSLSSRKSGAALESLSYHVNISYILKTAYKGEKKSEKDKRRRENRRERGRRPDELNILL